MMRSLAIVGLLATAAYADKPTSLAHYDKGKQAYAAGNFKLAVAEFEAAYAAWNTPEYLHDIGQAYRRLDRCNEAATSFESYLVAKPDAANRATVSDTVKQLRAKCPVVAAPPNPPAPVTTSVAEPLAAPIPALSLGTTTPTPARTDREAAVTKSAAVRTPSPWHPTASAGIVVLDAGPVVMPPIPDLSVGVLRDLRLPLDLQVGANLSVARLPFDDVMTGTVWLAGPELVASASRPLATKLSLFGGVAAGVQLVSGLGDGNPFTTNGMAHDSFITLRLRGELGVAWRASERLTLKLAPGYQFSPRRAPLAADINALHGFALHAGVAVDL